MVRAFVQRLFADPAVTRMISVDQRYMRWIMQEAFPAPQLLQEMGLPKE